MSKTKNYYEHITETVDKDTGEVEIIQRKVKRKVSRDHFIMMYLSDIQSIISLASKAEFKVLVAICELVDYNTNKIILIKPVKEQIAKKTDLNYNTVKNTISRLNSKEILVREDTSVYYLNPTYFFKGQEQERAKMIRLVLEYDIEDDVAINKPKGDDK